ncbi:response regulator transcription factor [Burkholderia thailandensis]|uniref:response regulator transcription factor n=1 Tax=Burkholderia thailandensis TaxID=57975 RepID=UPI002D77DD4F|nr:response regulator transcription factor [Burkholderia thailandensis]WRS70016.1 response regulator transcription factor [Burkholderia thailandensis]
MNIYLIEDDEVQARCYAAILEHAGYSVRILTNGERALREIKRAVPDMLVLDRRLPDIDGLEIIAWVREQYALLPILVLANVVLESDIVEALEVGADDYLFKPPREREFIARVNALRRRVSISKQYEGTIEIGSYRIETAERVVYYANERISLSPMEYEIVELLARHVGRVVPRNAVINRIWGHAVEEGVSRSLDTHIYRIRRKMKFSHCNGAMLRVVYTHGFRLDDFSHMRC